MRSSTDEKIIGPSFFRRTKIFWPHLVFKRPHLGKSKGGLGPLLREKACRSMSFCISWPDEHTRLKTFAEQVWLDRFCACSYYRFARLPIISFDDSGQQLYLFLTVYNKRYLPHLRRLQCPRVDSISTSPQLSIVLVQLRDVINSFLMAGDPYTVPCAPGSESPTERRAPVER